MYFDYYFDKLNCFIMHIYIYFPTSASLYLSQYYSLLNLSSHNIKWGVGVARPPLVHALSRYGSGMERQVTTWYGWRFLGRPCSDLRFGAIFQVMEISPPWAPMFGLHLVVGGLDQHALFPPFRAHSPRKRFQNHLL